MLAYIEELREEFSKIFLEQWGEFGLSVIGKGKKIFSFAKSLEKTYEIKNASFLHILSAKSKLDNQNWAKFLAVEEGNNVNLKISESSVEYIFGNRKIICSFSPAEGYEVILSERDGIYERSLSVRDINKVNVFLLTDSRKLFDEKNPKLLKSSHAYSYERNGNFDNALSRPNFGLPDSSLLKALKLLSSRQTHTKKV